MQDPMSWFRKAPAATPTVGDALSPSVARRTGPEPEPPPPMPDDDRPGLA